MSNQTIGFFFSLFLTMCLNPVLRQPVCEKLYHKMGYERKKKLPEKKEKRRGERERERASEHGFNWCLPVVWPLFRSPSFFLSLCLSRFNKASCRVWLSGGKKKASECGWSRGWIGASGARRWESAIWGGHHFRPTSCCTPQSFQPPVQCTVQSGGLAACRLFSALLSFHSFAHFLSKPTFSPAPSHSPCVCLPFPLLISTVQAASFPVSSYCASCCPTTAQTPQTLSPPCHPAWKADSLCW